MKFVKTTALAAAVATSFAAQDELKAMSDASLEEVTGQAGFTITTEFANSTDGIDISLGDEDGTTFGTNATTTAGFLNIFDVQNEGTVDIDFDGGQQAIVVNIQNATTINFLLG